MDLKLSYLIIEWMGFLNTDDGGINFYFSGAILRRGYQLCGSRKLVLAFISDCMYG